MLKPHWTSTEVDVLKLQYPRTRREHLLNLLDGRSWSSIFHKASRLKIRRSTHLWTDERVWNYVPLSHLSEADKGYIAGIIDGEGTISISGRRDRFSLRSYITISNTCVSMLKWVKSLIGGHISNWGGTPHNKIVYKLNIGKIKQIRDVLRILAPYFKVKKREAILVLEFCEIRLRGHADSYTNRELEIFRAIRNAIPQEQIRTL